MQEIFNISPIAQGAIGSAVFWVLLLLGQKFFGFISSHAKATAHDVSNQRVVASVMLEAVTEGKEPSKTSAAGVWCLLHSLKQIIKAAIFIVIGVAFSVFSKIFLVVGAFGCLVYLFSALSFSNIGWRKLSKNNENKT